MLLKKSSLQMESEAIQELVQGGVLTNVTSGGRVRSILSIISMLWYPICTQTEPSLHKVCAKHEEGR